MNYWMQLSVEYANQRNYLDDLFQVYPTIPEGVREVNKDRWASIEKVVKKQNHDALIHELLKLDLFLELKPLEMIQQEQNAIRKTLHEKASEISKT